MSYTDLTPEQQRLDGMLPAAIPTRTVTTPEGNAEVGYVRAIGSGFAEGDRIYATEMLAFGDAEDPDFAVERGDEGTVLGVRDHDVYDLLIEWDAGFIGAVDSGNVTLIGGK